MTNVIYVIFARQGFGYGEEVYPKEAHFFEDAAMKRVKELNEPEDDSYYFYRTVSLVNSDNSIQQ